MRERLADYQEQYGDLYNLEATPAESTTYRLAKHDKKRWRESKRQESREIPVIIPIPPICRWIIPWIFFDALDIQDEIQTLYTSGTVFHAFLGEASGLEGGGESGTYDCRELYASLLYPVPTYSICSEHGYLTGEQKVCPKCGRVTGFGAVSRDTTGRFRTGMTKSAGIREQDGIRPFPFCFEASFRKSGHLIRL